MSNLVSKQIKAKGSIPEFIVFESEERELHIFIYCQIPSQDILKSKLTTYKQSFKVLAIFLNQARVVYDYISYRISPQRRVHIGGLGTGGSVAAALALIIQ